MRNAIGETDRFPHKYRKGAEAGTCRLCAYTLSCAHVKPILRAYSRITFRSRRRIYSICVCRRRNVAFQCAAGETAQGKISVRAGPAVAGASAKGQRAFQLWRKRLFCFGKWTGDNQPSCRRGLSSEIRRRAAQLSSRRLLRENSGRREEVPRSRTQRADVNRGCD